MKRIKFNIGIKIIGLLFVLLVTAIAGNLFGVISIKKSMYSSSSDDSSTTDSSDNNTENITSEIINVNNAFTELEELISSFSNSEMIQALADYKEEYETYVTS